MVETEVLYVKVIMKTVVALSFLHRALKGLNYMKNSRIKCLLREQKINFLRWPK